jgi:arsenite-transporting ATPase
MDPAHSLGDALGVDLGPEPRRVFAGGGALLALELDADRALARWMGARKPAFRAIAERGTYLDDDDIERLMRLTLPGTDELIGLLELRRVARAGKYDLVVVDTAPTGHALRLLETPEALARLAQVLDEMQAKHRLLAESLAGTYRPDGADETILEIASEAAEARAMLSDRGRCEATWVLLPEALSIEETADALGALEALGLAVPRVLVNRVTPGPSRSCAQCSPRVEAERAAIARIRSRFRGRQVVLVGAADDEPRGVDALRALGRRDGGRRRAAHGAAPARPSPATSRPGRGVAMTAATAAMLAPGGARLVFFGGKGGVGKTTCAAATAIAIARRSRRVLLLSTDPAHSLSDVLGVPLGDDERPVPAAAGLHAREIDSVAAFERERERYREAVGRMFHALTRSPRFDAAYDRVVMEDLIDLAPSGIDEVFAVVSLVDALKRTARRRVEKAWDCVVVDTAPTGHTLRLLAMPRIARAWAQTLLGILLKYRRVLGLGELASSLLAFAKGARGLDEILRDESRARFVAVTRPAELPRLETARLIAALEQARIPCPALVVDAATVGACDRCRAAAKREAAEIAALARLSGPPGSSAGEARAILLAPAVYPPPRGVAALAHWASRWHLMRAPR